MDVCTEKNQMLQDIEPRLSLSSLTRPVDEEIQNEISFRQAFINVFKKPSGSVGEARSSANFKHIVTNLSDNKSGVDISLRTNGHPFNGHFILEGTAPRPAKVTVASGKSSIACTFPEHARGQAVSLKASSVHGTIQVGLPRDFDGYIVLQTLVGHVSRNKTLKMNCKKVIGFDTPANLTSSVYRVKPASLLPVNDNENAKCVDESSLHLCTVTSSHGIVKIGYTDEMKVFGRASATTATECTVS